jgi:hypothetical protein
MKRSFAIGAALVAMAVTGCSHSSESVDRANIALRPLYDREPFFREDRDQVLREEMRDLWSEHVVSTRNYIVAATSDDPGAADVLSGLMTNQYEMAATFIPMYGHAVGVQLATLLEDHISIAGEVVAAAKEFDNEKLDEANRRWHQNAEVLAGFLADVNPHWSRDALLGMHAERAPRADRAGVERARHVQLDRGPARLRARSRARDAHGGRDGERHPHAPSGVVS